jgi:excisionase family DNA binding protein
VTEPLLTAREVAEMLAVSPETVLRRWRAGELPGFRLAPNVLRFRAADIEAWLQGRRVNGPGAGGEVAPVPYQSPDPGRSLTVAPVPNREGENDAR